MTIKTITVYDWDAENAAHKIAALKTEAGYTVKVDGSTWSQHDTIQQASAEINSIITLYHWCLIPA